MVFFDPRPSPRARPRPSSSIRSGKHYVFGQENGGKEYTENIFDLGRRQFQQTSTDLIRWMPMPLCPHGS
jgi:hypothetical protein